MTIWEREPKKPEPCPICGGTGILHPGITCKPCQGTGLVATDKPQPPSKKS